MAKFDKDGNKIKKNKKDKKGKKKFKNSDKVTDNSIHECPKEDCGCSGERVDNTGIDFKGNYTDFTRVKNSFPAVPNGSSPAYQDYFLETEHGQLRVRVNADSETKAGRRNTQLDGKQIIASQLKALLDGATSPVAEVKDPIEAPPEEDDNILERVFKKKAVKAQLALSGDGDTKLCKVVLKELGKKISGKDLHLRLTREFGMVEPEAMKVLEALCR